MSFAILVCLAAPADLHRFPDSQAANVRLRILVEHRFAIRLQLSIDKRNGERLRKALEKNGQALACWEALVEAGGSFAQEEGGRDDADTREAALERLRDLLGEKDWTDNAVASGHAEACRAILQTRKVFDYVITFSYIRVCPVTDFGFWASPRNGTGHFCVLVTF